MKRNPQIEAFCERVAIGYPLVHASEYAGLSQNSSNASKLARRPYPAQRIQALQNAGPKASRTYAFSVMILVTGSRSKAYRETYPCDALKAATVRARASRLFRQLPVQEKLSALTPRFPAEWIHAAALPLIERAEVTPCQNRHPARSNRVSCDSLCLQKDDGTMPGISARIMRNKP